MKTKTFHRLLPQTSRSTFLRVPIHCSPRQPRQTSPLLFDDLRRRTSMAPALQSRRRLQRPRIKNHRVAIQIRHNPAHVVSVPRLAMGANRMADVDSSSQTRWPVKATFNFGSAVYLRSEGWRVKRCGQRRQVAKRCSTASTHGSYRYAQNTVKANHCYDVLASVLAVRP